MIATANIATIMLTMARIRSARKGIKNDGFLCKNNTGVGILLQMKFQSILRNKFTMQTPKIPMIEKHIEITAIILPIEDSAVEEEVIFRPLLKLIIPDTCKKFNNH